MVWFVKIYPTKHKVHGEGRIVYAFSDTFDEALCQILAHRNEVGLFVDDEYAREIVRRKGICALNAYMDFSNIESVCDGVWNKD